MKRHFYIAAALTALLISSCTQISQTARLAQGPVVLAIEPVKAQVHVDTTRTLIGMSSTTHVLGLIRFGDREFADYPGMVFGFGGPTREKRAAIYKALEGTGADVLVNPKFIVKEKNAFIFSKTTVQVAGFGGKFEFE